MKRLIVLTISFLLMFTTGCNVVDDLTDKDDDLENDKEDLEGEDDLEQDLFIPSINNPELDGYKFVWGDEFDYTGAPDSTKWGYDLGNGSAQGIPGWGNNELQYYTDRSDNVYVDNGYMTINAIKENYVGHSYTSARVVTKGKADFTYGYAEISAQMPRVQGTWTALWMLPTGNVYGGWPYSGEIDIMEQKGQDKTTVLGTLHTGYRNWWNGALGNANGNSMRLTQATEQQIVYGLLWTEDKIEIYANGVKYFTENRKELKGYVEGADDAYMHWPYDQDFHFIFNVAVGGTLGGNVASNFGKASMVIDYIRVFQK